MITTTWQTVNDVNKRKSTCKAKLKSASQEERIHMCKDDFKCLFGKSSKVSDKLKWKLLIIN